MTAALRHALGRLEDDAAASGWAWDAALSHRVDSLLVLIEGAIRRDFSLAVKERILQVGFLMILALISVILYNDLAKNLPAKLWPF